MLPPSLRYGGQDGGQRTEDRGQRTEDRKTKSKKQLQQRINRGLRRCGLKSDADVADEKKLQLQKRKNIEPPASLKDAKSAKKIDGIGCPEKPPVYDSADGLHVNATSTNRRQSYLPAGLSSFDGIVSRGDVSRRPDSIKLCVLRALCGSMSFAVKGFSVNRVPRTHPKGNFDWIYRMDWENNLPIRNWLFRKPSIPKSQNSILGFSVV